MESQGKPRWGSGPRGKGLDVRAGDVDALGPKILGVIERPPWRPYLPTQIGRLGENLWRPPPDRPPNVAVTDLKRTTLDEVPFSHKIRAAAARPGPS